MFYLESLEHVVDNVEHDDETDHRSGPETFEGSKKQKIDVNRHFFVEKRPIATLQGRETRPKEARALRSNL